jgi:hypothetical protein
VCTVTDVLIVGGGLGGVAAALAASSAGLEVVLTEETDWLGGQLTAQAVPPDEHPWIESFGCTARYRRLRDAIRDHYRRWYPLTPEARAARHLNPGAGRVSRLCHEPRVALAVIDGMLAPLRAAGRLVVLHHTRATAVDVDGDHVRGVRLEDTRDGREHEVRASYVLDATETGELLPLTGTEHVTGSEARTETDEPHASEEARATNMQAVTHCFAVEHRSGEDHTIDRPPSYGRWLAFVPPGWPGPLLSWETPDPKTGLPRTHTFTPNPDDDPAGIEADMRAEGGADDLWTFRRILARNNLVAGAAPSDVTLVNWPQADYLGGAVFGGTDEEDRRHREGARDLSLCLLRWLQTDAPRPDGGTGWPGLRLRPDVVGTDDGLAKSVYIRESRRVRARCTVVEQDLAADVRGDAGAVPYPDTVGIGAYRIDLHPTTGGDPYLDVAAHPFRIPLGALLPERMRNLLPAGKDIGTTHITNGCYRLHPVEWNIGEAAGELVAFCVERGSEPQAVHADADLLTAFQERLVRAGVELSWPQVSAY